MYGNNSPWIKQLNRTRPVEPLEENLQTDIVVIGGGIAGITTAYFLLTTTNFRVLLLEAGKVAHGATGHNAGQVTSYFEKPFSELVAEHGRSKARAAQVAIERDARMLLEGIFFTAQLNTPHSEFMGYRGCLDLPQVIDELRELSIKGDAGLPLRHMLVAREWDGHRLIPSGYAGLYTLTSHQNILSLLETEVSDYIAVTPFLSGCMNSALFTEELAGFLLASYKDRFVLREHTVVHQVILNAEGVLLEAGVNTVSARKVVLCTNGFESLHIVNRSGKDIDGEFHHNVGGVVGYMGAYRTPMAKAPFASIYLEPHYLKNRTYFYTTVRPFGDESHPESLMCVGGPVSFIPDRGTYDARKSCPDDIRESIENFAAATYGYPLKMSMDFHWHGVMGYTKSGMRLIGAEPKNKNLLYNLGCNGVGLLTSIYGAEKIARLINGEIISASVFDPR